MFKVEIDVTQEFLQEMKEKAMALKGVKLAKEVLIGPAGGNPCLIFECSNPASVYRLARVYLADVPPEELRELEDEFWENNVRLV